MTWMTNTATATATTTAATTAAGAAGAASPNYGGYAAMILQAGGAVTSAMGAGASARSAQSNLALQAGNQRMQAIEAAQQGQNEAFAYRQQSLAALGRAGAADFNAVISEQGAQQALDQGQFEGSALSLKAGQLKGTQRARLAASGVDLGQGNAAEIQVSTDMMKALDMSTIAANAARSAWGYRVQAANYTWAAEAERLTASQLNSNADLALSQGGLRASAYNGQAGVSDALAGAVSPISAIATSLLGSAGQVASSWYRYSKET